MMTLRARTVFSDKRLTVTAIESLEFQTHGSNRGRRLSGSLKPIAVVVKEPERSYAIDMDAQLLDIEQLELPADFELE